MRHWVSGHLSNWQIDICYLRLNIHRIVIEDNITLPHVDAECKSIKKGFTLAYVRSRVQGTHNTMTWETCSSPTGMLHLYCTGKSCVWVFLRMQDQPSNPSIHSTWLTKSYFAMLCTHSDGRMILHYPLYMFSTGSWTADDPFAKWCLLFWKGSTCHCWRWASRITPPCWKCDSACCAHACMDMVRLQSEHHAFLCSQILVIEAIVHRHDEQLAVCV